MVFHKIVSNIKLSFFWLPYWYLQKKRQKTKKCLNKLQEKNEKHIEDNLKDITSRMDF
jgi:hypothetical protein